MEPWSPEQLSPEQLGGIQDAARLAGMLPYLENEIRSMERALENRVFGLIDAKTLTAEAALAAWLEKIALVRLLRRFQTKINVENAAPTLVNR